MGADWVDVAVVGAGPAGCAAAAALAAAGRRTLLLEKAALPRYKTCGGAVVQRSALGLELGAATVVQRELRAAQMHVHGAVPVTVRRETAFLCMTMRADLDAWLAARARDAGAEIRAPCAVTGLVQREDGVVLQTSTGPVRAGYVVAADGVTSRVARAAGWAAPPRVAAALEWEVPVDAETFARFAGAARFDFGLLAGGYAWVFPKRSHLSVGILGTRRPARQLRQLLWRYLEMLRLAPVQAMECHAAIIPLAPRQGGCARGRVFLAGDAAGLVDPLTCEGITYALRSGTLVAAALLAATPAGARQAYAAALRREILPELGRARLLAQFLYATLARQPWLFERLGQPFCNAMVEVLAGQRTYGELLGAPSNYARLLRRLCFPARARVRTADTERDEAHAPLR